MSGDFFSNRVRAFSVGSQIKHTSACLKTNPKYLNNNFQNYCSEKNTKKSISVPMLITKSFKSVEEMAYLMEIDFSKPLKTSNQEQSKIECQTLLNKAELYSSISMESLAYEHNDNGYLEMKPITVGLATSSCKRNDGIIIDKNQQLDSMQNNGVDNVMGKSEFQGSNKVEDICLKYSTDDSLCTKDVCKKGDTTKTSNENYNIASIKVHTSTKKGKYDVNICTTCSDVLESSKLNSMTNLKNTSNNCIKNNGSLKYGESLSLNNELNYASLDLPLCNKDLKKRSNVKESLSDTNIGHSKNVYAKIHFDQPETSSFNIRKNNNK